MKAELAIVGAGPAGMAAARVAAESDVEVTVIDEQRAPGGQYLRQPPPEFSVSNWLPGPTYRSGKKLLTEAESLAVVNWQMQTSAVGLIRQELPDRGFELILDDAGRRLGAGQAPDGHRVLEAEAVLLAPGCFDLPVLFPGWNLPGVMAAGGIQAFVKSQQFVPGTRFLFSGSHPLQLIIADQILKAGGEVAGVLFAQSRSRALELLAHPSVLLGNRDKLRQTADILNRLKKAGVPVRFNRTVVAAHGPDHLESVSIAPVGRHGRVNKERAEQVACDRLGICYSFLTSTELARQVGAACRWEAPHGGFVVEADAGMQSTVEGLYVAGEITGVAGSEVAALEGEIAGYHLLAQLGRLSAEEALRRSAPVHRRLKKALRFARLLSRLAWPGHLLLDQLLEPSVTLCKCEEVTVGQVDEMLTANPHVTTANAAKLLSRTGMGLCQGRYCHFGLAGLIARRRGIKAGAVGGFTARFPSKPIGIDQLLEAAPGNDEGAAD